MGTFIAVPDGVDADTAFNVVGYTPPCNDGLRYVADTLVAKAESAGASIAQGGTFLTAKLAEMATAVKEGAFDNMRYMRDSVLRKNAAMSTVDIVRPILSVGGLQTANPAMLHYIMAEPELRKLYHAQCVDGYSGQYVDLYPALVGEDHEHYREVMDGIIVDTETGWEATCYELESENLTPREQMDIYDTHTYLRHVLATSREDPTCTLNSKRGVI